MEIGAGQGAISARIAERFDYVGVEADAEAADVARRRVDTRGGVLIHGDAATDAPPGPFDAVCAFEVLEHIEDDAGALHHWKQLLAPGGTLILSVPAHQDRFGPWDRAVGHYRRYDPAALAELLRSAGLVRVDVVTYGFPLGYALEFVRDRAARRRGTPQDPTTATAHSGRTLQPVTGMGLLTWAVTLPFRILQRPFARWRLGTGIVATAALPGRPR